MIAAELRGGNKPSLNEALGWIGSRVDDIFGANVGRLEDVWIDPGTGAPRWLLVKEGRFGGRTTLIPFEDATAGAGHVWVPYEREVVRDAPEIEAGAPLTQQVEAALRNHYATNAPAAISHRGQSEAAPGGPAAGQAPMPPSSWQQPPSTQAPAAEGSPPPAPPPPAPAAAGEQQAPAQAPPPTNGPGPTEQGRAADRQPAEPQAAPPPAAETNDPPQDQGDAGSVDLAGFAGSHQIEIELSGSLTIRGDLRNVRIVPREQPPQR